MKKLLISFLFIVLFASTNTFAATVYKTNVIASHYGKEFHGKQTSNGETFNMNAYTCAHKLLPFDTILKVTNLSNGKSVNVRINDRGPFVVGREIDLSTAAAKKLDMIGVGTTKVRIEIVKMGPDNKLSQQTAASAKKMMAAKGEIISHPQKKPTAADTSPDTIWLIQAGAFSSKENATKRAKELSKAGIKNIYFQTSGNIVRVVIKNIKSEELSEIESKLLETGITEYTKKKQN